MEIYMDMICRSISNNIYSRCVYIYAFLLIFVFISCEKNNPRAVREIKEMMGREIVFSKCYSFVSQDKSFNKEDFISKEIKMITYVSKDQSCNECTLNALQKWHAQVKDIMVGDFTYIIVFCSDDKTSLLKALDNIYIPTPIICYETDIFEKENKLDVLAKNKTFLLNRENKIVLVGEPFYNDKLFDLYKRTVATLKDEYAFERCK